MVAFGREKQSCNRIKSTNVNVSTVFNPINAPESRVLLFMKKGGGGGGMRVLFRAQVHKIFKTRKVHVIVKIYIFCTVFALDPLGDKI